MISHLFRTVAELESLGEVSLQTGPFGTQLKASEYVDEGIPVINVRNIGFGDVRKEDLEYLNEAKAEKIHQHRLRKGDIVFGRKGAVERHALIDESVDGWIQGSDCLRLRIKSQDVCERYLSHYLKTQAHQDWMQALCSFGATMTSLNQDIVRRISFPSPPIEAQKRIAATLTAYDELIENNQRRIALLEKMSEEVYREWFVRLRFPSYEKVKKLRGVPDGWKEQKFGQFCQLQRGFDLTDAEVEPGQYPVIASTSIKTYHSQYKVEPPVITTGRSGSLGEVLFVNTRAWPHNTALYVKNFFGNSAFLVYYTLKSMRLENFNAGAGVPTLNRNHLNGIPIIVPSKEIQDQFDSVVSKLYAQAELLRNANQKLTMTRGALLPRLISGKLSVENLDIQFPSSMLEDAHA
ncbi:MAG: restriction endonuclease subunit S [Sulfuricellaceae bacterium]